MQSGRANCGILTQVQPFSARKQTAVTTGVANAIGVAPSDVSLTLQNVFSSQVIWRTAIKHLQEDYNFNKGSQEDIAETPLLYPGNYG